MIIILHIYKQTKCLSVTNYSIEIKNKIHQKINYFSYYLNYALKKFKLF